MGACVWVRGCMGACVGAWGRVWVRFCGCSCRAYVGACECIGVCVRAYVWVRWCGCVRMCL